MKPESLFGALLLAAAVWMPSAPLGLAGLPQPMCVYYGQARDGFGLPYRTNAYVLLLHGTNEIARQTVRGSLSPGVNFALYVHLDDGRSPVPYSSRALRSGDLVSIVVRDPAGQKTIMESQAVPAVGQPGELVLVNATAAEDSDGDGLPDQWEQELIAWSDGWLRTLADVRPQDDFDRDGMTNLDEYLAGTFAFLDYDRLAIEGLGHTPNHRLRLTFLSVPGKLYRIQSAADLAQAAWGASSFALSEEGLPETVSVEGNGGWVSLYVPIGEPARFFRLDVQ